MLVNVTIELTEEEVSQIFLDLMARSDSHLAGVYNTGVMSFANDTIILDFSVSNDAGENVVYTHTSHLEIPMSRAADIAATYLRVPSESNLIGYQFERLTDGTYIFSYQSTRL